MNPVEPLAVTDMLPSAVVAQGVAVVGVAVTDRLTLRQGSVGVGFVVVVSFLQDKKKHVPMSKRSVSFFIFELFF